MSLSFFVRSMRRQRERLKSILARHFELRFLIFLLSHGIGFSLVVQKRKWTKFGGKCNLERLFGLFLLSLKFENKWGGK